MSAYPAGVQILQPSMAAPPGAMMMRHRWHALSGSPTRTGLERRTTVRGVLSTAESHTGHRTAFSRPPFIVPFFTVQG